GGVTSGAARLWTGQGRVDASFRSSQGGIMADATVKDLRASDLQPFVTAEFPIREAVLGGAADVRSEGGVLHGNVHARVDQLAVTVADEKFENAVIVLDAKLDDHDASYLTSVILDGEAALNVSSEHVHVPKLATDRASLLAVTGRTQIDANATFACLHTWFGDRVPSTAGQAEVRLVYEHYEDGPHLASFEVQTTGAEIETEKNGDIRGIDALAGGIVSLDDAHADLGASLTDRLGALVLVRVGAAFDAPVWDTGAMSDVERWKRTPATVHVEVPDREIATLPSQVRPTEIEGRIAALFDITGSALAPTAAFSIDERGGRLSSRKGEPLLDLHVEGTYDQKVLAATLGTQGARAASLGGEVRLLLPWTDVLTGKAGDTWEASAMVRAEKLALGSITGWFTRTGITGTVSGVVNVGGLHRDAIAGVDLVLDQIAIGKRQVGSGHVVALLSGGRAAANVDLVQRVGRLDMAVGGKAQWGASLAPSLNLVDGVDGYIRAKAFDVSFVRPLVREVLPGFNAVIDSAMAFHLTSDMKASHAVGMVMLSGGRAEVATLGDELKDVRVRVDMAQDGKAKISQVEIYPATGRINAYGEAVFDGLEFRSALLHLRIPRDAEIPVGIEGMPVGELQGNVDVTLRHDANGIGIGVTIPSVHLLLSPALGRNVQSLDPDPHIHVGTRTLRGGFASGAPILGAPATASSSIPVHIDVSLGDDVWVKRQSDLEARITGKVAVDLGTQLRLAGAVSVSEGWVEIQGRRFSVERARVSFDGQPPSDPVIQATARYDAPGGVKIFADYVGAVSTGRVFLRSEPSMAANEIVSTLVFGSPTAQVGASSGSGSTALQAAALGGGYATQGLNRALDDISPLDVSTRVDTTSSSNPRPELTVRVTKNVGVTLGVNLGTPSPGQPPDRTILRLEYQFLPHWRVRSTDGDKGSSILDFIWQYQY
ncbi:MAG TPA: translocation/assembly module TamB domain-containing protein, partial [Polyangiaceae bacterium]